MHLRQWLYAGAISAIAIVFLINTGISQEQKPVKVEKSPSWVKYDKGLALAAKENKPIIIDFYTNWCGWCKKMDKDTFANDSIAKYLVDKFITVKVNAESNDMLVTAGGSISERDLARSFGVRGYPTYFFLKPSGEKIYNVASYFPPERFITLLRYIGDDHYKTKTIQEYSKSLQSN